MKKISILLLSLCLLFVASCDGFLDVQPTDAASSESAIVNVTDAQIFMNRIMRGMTSTSYYGRLMFLYADAKGGDLALQAQGRGDDALYVFSHVPTSAYGGFWNQIYACLMQVNVLIENVDRIIDEGNSSAALLTVKGQALTLRALMHFDLVRLYGKPYTMDRSSLGVPLALEPIQADAQPTRASVDEVYTQIIKDLRDAEPLFATRTRVNGYVNYFGNQAILARAYLYMERYTEALAAAENVINSNVYTLYTNANWVGSWRLQHGTESILELVMNVGEADATTTSLGYYLRRANHGAANLGNFVCSDYLLERMYQDPEDVRLGIRAADSYLVPRPHGCCYKWSGDINLGGDGKGSATAVNIKLIRLSEVVLIAAEAALGANNREKAADYLNRIRRRAPNLEPATAATVDLDMIADERSKELSSEGHRFFDMMRWNRSVTFNDDIMVTQTIITHRAKTIDRTFHRTILPISQDEMNANPAMVQNPGY